MPSDAFYAELQHLTVADWQTVLLRAADLFPGGVKAAYDVALKTYRAALPMQDEEAPQLLRAGEFLRVIGEPPAMLVDRILPDKSLILLAGKPKSGKSLAAIDLLDAVSRGIDVWSLFPVRRSGPVVYFGMEDGKYEIANRLLARGIKAGDERPFYVCYNRFNLSRPESLDGMKRLIESVGITPSLICIDTAREALGIKDWSNPSEVVEVVRPLRDFAHDYCPVLLVTHNRKAAAEDAGDEIAGTNAFTGAVDGWLSAHKVEKSKEMHRLHIRADGRGGMRDEFVLDMDMEHLTWRALTDDEMQKAAKESQRAARQEQYREVALAVESLSKAGKATVMQIAIELGAEDRTVRNLVSEMLELKYLTTTGERYSAGAGRPSAVYTLGPDISELRNNGISPNGSSPAEISNPAPAGYNGPASPAWFAGLDGDDEEGDL